MDIGEVMEGSHSIQFSWGLLPLFKLDVKHCDHRVIVTLTIISTYGYPYEGGILFNLANK